VKKAAAICALIFLLAGTASAAEKPSFASAPALSPAGGRKEISFSVKEPCAAAVWVEDADGKIVRRIAAGMLGPKAPPPFQKGLVQRIAWDGRDARGKPVPAGCRVKVGLGLEARFAGLLGYDPGTVGKVLSTARDGKGNVYVMTHDDYPLRSTPTVLVFSAGGKYLRTLLPWSAKAPWEKVKPYWVELDSGQRIPRIHHLFQALYPLAPKQEKRTWENGAKISGESLKLTPGGKAPKASGEKGIFRPMHIVASRTRDEVFVRQWTGAQWTRFDGATGKATPLALKNVGEIAAAPDGTLFGHRDNSSLVQLDRDGKVLRTLDEKILGTVRGGHYRGVRGLGVSPAGEIYLLHYAGVQPGSSKGLGKEGGDWSTVLLDVYSPDGRKRASNLLTLTAAAAGVRIARDGSIYVAEDVMPEDRPLPAEFAKIKGRPASVYRYIYGSIVRFGPEGGKVIAYRRGKKAPEEGKRGVNLHWSGTRRVRLTGQFRGFVTSTAPTGAGWGQCTCHGARFDVDGFGRVFVPEVTRFSIKVVDAAGNLLVRIGTYGNADDGPQLRIADCGVRSEGAKNRKPVDGSPNSAICFAWPAHVAVTDRAVYVSDMVNRRVVRVKLSCRTEATCPVRQEGPGPRPRR